MPKGSNVVPFLFMTYLLLRGCNIQPMPKGTALEPLGMAYHIPYIYICICIYYVLYTIYYTINHIIQPK